MQMVLLESFDVLSRKTKTSLKDGSTNDILDMKLCRIKMVSQFQYIFKCIRNYVLLYGQHTNSGCTRRKLSIGVIFDSSLTFILVILNHSKSNC